jgi:gas vesicle protein
MEKGAKMRKLSSFLFGAFLGSAVGVLMAILLAPASGEDLRQRVRDFGNKTVEEIRQAAQRRREELEAELAKLRQPRSDQVS